MSRFHRLKAEGNSGVVKKLVVFAPGYLLCCYPCLAKPFQKVLDDAQIALTPCIRLSQICEKELGADFLTSQTDSTFLLL